MAKIKSINVKITFKVGLADITKVPKNVLKELQEAEGEEIGNDAIFPLAFNWIRDNIKERDCFDWQAEIEDITLP